MLHVFYRFYFTADHRNHAAVLQFVVFGGQAKANFTNIHQDYFTGIGAIVLLSSVSETALEEMNKYISWIHTQCRYKQNKASTTDHVSISEGILCISIFGVSDSYCKQVHKHLSVITHCDKLMQLQCQHRHRQSPTLMMFERWYNARRCVLFLCFDRLIS